MGVERRPVGHGTEASPPAQFKNGNPVFGTKQPGTVAAENRGLLDGDATNEEDVELRVEELQNEQEALEPRPLEQRILRTDARTFEDVLPIHLRFHMAGCSSRNK